MSQLPPELQTAIPKPTDRAQIIPALTTFGQWVKQVTDYAVDQVNPDSIINRALAQVPVMPYRVDVVKTSRTIAVPTEAKSARITLRAGGARVQAVHYTGAPVSIYLSPEHTVWRKLQGVSSLNIVIGASTRETYFTLERLGSTILTIGNETIGANPGTYLRASTGTYLNPFVATGYEETDYTGRVTIEWFKQVPEGL